MYQIILKNIQKPRFEIESKNGNTKDIQSAIFEVYNDYKDTTKNITKYFKGKNKIETAKNIWNFVRKNIEYKEDPDGKQYVKSPSRLIFDKQGDCKSIAIFIASVLTNLGFKNGFRFVSYKKNSKNVTHIYNYFENEKNEKIFVDGCISEFNKPQNNFFYKEDYDNKNMTEISKINGFKTTDVSNYIGKGRFEKYEGKILVTKNNSKIGFFGGLGDFFASIDPTTSGTVTSNFLTNIDPTAEWSAVSQGLAWIDPTTNPFTAMALTAAASYYGVPPEVTQNVLKIMGKLGKGEMPLEEIKTLLAQNGIKNVDAFLKTASENSRDPQTITNLEALRAKLRTMPEPVSTSLTAPVSAPNGVFTQNEPKKSNNTFLYLAGAGLLYMMMQGKTKK